MCVIREGFFNVLAGVLGFILFSFQAYKNFISRNGINEKKPSGLSGLSHDQLFFVGYAQVISLRLDVTENCLSVSAAASMNSLTDNSKLGSLSRAHGFFSSSHLPTRYIRIQSLPSSRILLSCQGSRSQIHPLSSRQSPGQNTFHLKNVSSCNYQVVLYQVHEPY